VTKNIDLSIKLNPIGPAIPNPTPATTPTPPTTPTPTPLPTQVATATPAASAEKYMVVVEVTVSNSTNSQQGVAIETTLTGNGYKKVQYLPPTGGSEEFIDMPAGEYDLTIKLAGYHTYTEKVNVTGITYLYVKLSPIGPVNPTSNLSQANDLKELGLFMGSNGNFDLEQRVTRAQGAVMLVKLIGKGEEALAKNYPHPFKDVPSWASPFVGYLYQNKLTSGVSKTAYGSLTYMTPDQYVTFVLRALGYNDSLGDFTVPTSLDKAVKVGLLSADERYQLKSAETFLRNDVVLISHNAMVSRIKGTNQILAKKLLSEGAISQEAIDKTNLLIKERTDGTNFHLINDGYTHYLDGWIYFNNYLSSKTGGDLERIKVDGTGRQLVLPLFSINSINNDYLFKVGIVDAQGYYKNNLCKYTYDGNMVQTYTDQFLRFKIVGDWIYYTKYVDSNPLSPQEDKGTLWKMKLDETEKQKVINQEISDFYIVNNSIYYSTIDRAFYKYDLSSNQKTKLLDLPAHADNIQEYKGNIYFTVYDQKSFAYLYKYSPQDNSSTKIELPSEKKYLGSVFILNDEVYYGDRIDKGFNYLKKCKLDGTSVKILCDEKHASLNVIGDYLYFAGLNLPAPLYRYNYKSDGPIQKLMPDGWKLE